MARLRWAYWLCPAALKRRSILACCCCALRWLCNSPLGASDGAPRFALDVAAGEGMYGAYCDRASSTRAESASEECSETVGRATTEAMDSVGHSDEDSNAQEVESGNEQQLSCAGGASGRRRGGRRGQGWSQPILDFRQSCRMPPKVAKKVEAGLPAKEQGLFKLLLVCSLRRAPFCLLNVVSPVAV